MDHGMKPLSESVLRRLTSEALCTFLGEAACFEAAARPGLQSALSNEPMADLNMLVAGGEADPASFRAMAASCLDRDLPFLVMIFPDAKNALDDVAKDLGLLYAVDFPIMVRDDLPVTAMGNNDVAVSRAAGAADAMASATVTASAYSMPRESVLRALPASLLQTPGADVFLARLDGEALGSVTLTYHGDTAGIWAMGTDSTRQRGGIGARLLTAAMGHAREDGCRRFFLGATPAGYRLYEKLGFKTVCAARVWVSGETNQG